MKNLCPLFYCISFALLIGCGESEKDPKQHGGSVQTERSAPAAEGSPKTSSPGPSAAVVDKVSCAPGCTKVSTVEPSGCCHCKGRDGAWQRAAWSGTTWLCQPIAP